MEMFVCFVGEQVMQAERVAIQFASIFQLMRQPTLSATSTTQSIKQDGDGFSLSSFTNVRDIVVTVVIALPMFVALCIQSRRYCFHSKELQRSIALVDVAKLLLSRANARS
jgi:hypothetical protein